MTRTEHAYAKINLFLDVCGRRRDGFHDVRTVMETVSLSDVITVCTDVQSEGEHTLSLTLCGATDGVPSGADNLVFRAADAYRTATAWYPPLAITLEKKIPVAAGLAGGSADAAAVLRVLDTISPVPLGRERLLEIAATLGSDVPFCLLGGRALCEGRGERITPLPQTKSVSWYVLCAGEDPVETPWAYRQLDARYGDFGALTHPSDEPFPLFNIFESIVLPFVPRADACRTHLLALGARGALMSGSGSSVFGVFEGECDAQRVARCLCSRGVQAFAVHSVAPMTGFAAP